MSKKLTLEEVLERAKQSYLEKEKRAEERRARSDSALATDRRQAQSALLAMQNLSKRAKRELKPVFERLRAFCAGVSYGDYLRDVNGIRTAYIDNESAEAEE